MKKIIKVVILSTIFTASQAMAHEGHNHDAPTTLKAPKGGVIKALDESRVEVISKGKEIKIYVYDKDLKPAAAAGFSIVAHAQMPRSKKLEEIKLMAGDVFFEGTFDAKGTHRYTLKLAVTDSKTSRTDNITFTIEPRK